MEIALCTFASGSGGNCYLIKSEETVILLDVGISGKHIFENMAMLRLGPEDVDAVFVTHEHVDHIRSIATVERRTSKSKIYMSRGTAVGMIDKHPAPDMDKISVIRAGDVIEAGDIKVTAFAVSHDAREPLAYTFEKNGRKIAVVTDTGYITEEIFQSIRGADILVIEANHERNILLFGSYPYNVKHRILSDKGHLSNEACGGCIARLLRDLDGSKSPLILLAHLSQENNTPDQALITIKNMLEEESFYAGKDYRLEVIEPDVASRLMAL